MASMDSVATGIEIANHSNQDRGGFIDPRAIRFWGEEIGEASPPMLDARAIAICRQPPLVGNLRLNTSKRLI
jgi:hypothetical protein